MNYNVINKNKSAVFHSFSQMPITRETELPNERHNYTLVDKKRIDYYVNRGEYSIPILKERLSTSNDEREITESLYIVDQLIDNKVKGSDKMYPTLSRLNNTRSGNIQTFLAGIYRKTHPPDAFGPLVSMLIKNSIETTKTSKSFDANEEIGGAILSYLA